MSKRYMITFDRERHIEDESDFGFDRDEALSSWDVCRGRVAEAAKTAGATRLIEEASWAGTVDQVISIVDAWYMPDYGGPSYESMTEEDVESHVSDPDDYAVIFSITAL
jgi:hypothetical protein